MEERTLFKTWLLFLFLGLSFHVVFYFHDRSTILNISFWGSLLILLIIVQNFINNPIKSSRYTLFIYPILSIVSFYLLKNTISPYIHFSLSDTFYYFEYDKLYNEYIRWMNNIVGMKEALLFFSLINITFYLTFIFFIFYYIIATPITTLRRVFNGLFSIIGIILIIHFLLPTLHHFIHKDYNDMIISTNNFLLSYFNISNMGLSSFETSISLFMGLTLFRTTKLLGSVYIIFSLLVIGSTLYFKTAYITDIVISVIVVLLVFFKISKGFSQNKKTLHI